MTSLNADIPLEPRVSCFLYEENLLTKQMDLNDTVVPFMQKASIFWGKESKVPNALKIYILFYKKRVAHRQVLANFGLSYMHFHCFDLFSCCHSNFPYTAEKNTDGEIQ